MRYKIIYERSPNNFSAYSPDVPCIAAGDTLDETRILMREAIALYREEQRKDGFKVPPAPTGYIEILDFEPEKRQRRRPKPRPKPRPVRKPAKTPRTATRTRTP